MQPDISILKEHPRFLELKIVLLHDMIAKAYTDNVATEYFRLLCRVFSEDWNLINAILGRRFSIKRMEKTNKTRYRQEAVILGEIYGESRYLVAEKYLGVSKPIIYQPKLKKENFLTEAWVDKLDEEVELCGNIHYKNSAARFLNTIEELQRNLGYVSIPKTEL